MIREFKFKNFYHPYAELMVEQFENHGVKGLLKSSNHSLASDADKALYKQQGLASGFHFRNTYSPNVDVVRTPFPAEDFDFAFGGPFSNYNWEIFFHNPLLVAERLSLDQKFEEAQEWFHYVFDPTISEGTAPSRFWRLKPFANLSETPAINRLLAELSANGDNSTLNEEINIWKGNPFRPHLLAEMRIVSYMKYTVMKYLDNLIAWGDSLFRQDTMESINEATQIYLLAASILGERPQKVGREDTVSKDYETLMSEATNGLDAFSNALIELENGLVDPPTVGGSSSQAFNSSLGAINILFFCVPNNRKLDDYWDTVADRLFKIRNCQNIDGVARQLALFAPVIDPLQLVIAVGRGGSYLERIKNLNAPLPNYRFRYMIQRAIELCGEVKSLGGALLSALEKKDSEVIAGIRNQHEIKVLENLRHAKKLAVDESNQAIETLIQSKDNINYRYGYYQSRQYMNREEKLQLRKLKSAMDIEVGLATTELLLGTLEAIPGLSFGTNGAMGSPHFAFKSEGKSIGAPVGAMIKMVKTLADKERYNANRASIKAGFKRRKEDWDFQAQTAKIELAQIDKQIEGANHRREIALYELELNERQMDNAVEIAEVMETKYTNKELYNWMIQELSGLYFRSYQLALDVAKVAERCYQFERFDERASFIQPFNWDSLKKGLLAGERLSEDLRRMQNTFDDTNQRKLEMSKHVSLRMLDVDAIIELRREGKCTFQIPEVLFDLDFPGHIRRRIKSVSISIPCVVGPQTNIPAKLTLGTNLVRKDASNPTSYGRQANDDRFVVGRGGSQSIATSTANRDAGMFELNFNDERYLPFEGAGVISDWTLELPDVDLAQFDYNSISDVILHISYEAEEGGIREQVTNYLKSNINEIVEQGEDWTNMISLKQQFSSELYQFFNPTSGNMTTTLSIDDKHYPYFFRGRTRTSSLIEMIVVPKSGTDPFNGETATITVDGTPLNLTYDSSSKLLKGSISVAISDMSALEIIKTADVNDVFVDANVDDVIINVHFEVS